MNQKIEIGIRLREYGSQNYSSLVEFASVLGMKPQTLNSYLSGKITPGGELLSKLSLLGCDIKWLLNGSPSDSFSSNFDKGFESSGVYKVLGSIPAGKAEFSEWENVNESKSIDYDPDTHFYLKVDSEFGYSMMPVVNPGDLVLVSTTAKVKDGDLVAAIYDKTKGALKIYNENKDAPFLAILTSYNQAIPPIIIKKENLQMYKVVLIEKVK